MDEEEKTKIEEEDPGEISPNVDDSTDTSISQDIESPYEEQKNLAEKRLDDLKMERANFINYKARVKREQDDARLYANQAIVGEFLEIKDNLERALDAQGDAESVRDGVRLTLKNLDTLLKKHGITEIDPEGGAFDPNLHEAMMADDGDVDEETVSEVLQKGYMLNKRVIRPAKVKIIKPKT